MYGLTDDLRMIALDKIKRQKRFLSENGVDILGNQYRLIDFFKNSFINSDRYIAEVNNRVSSLYRYAKEKNLVNVFVTLTLPSEYHPKKTLRNGKIIDNPRFIDDEDHSSRSGARELSRMFNRIQQLRAYRDIPKDQKVYFRVYEPHKDGTPHLHASIFIPEDCVEAFVKSASNWCKKYGIEQYKFETDIKNPVAYLMKYILKTFDDLRKDDGNITDLTLWYIVHGICRFYTSRTLISLEIYKKFRGAFDLLEVTKMYRNQEFSVLVDTVTKKTVMIYDDTHVIYSRKPVRKLQSSYQPVPSEWRNRRLDFIFSEIDGKEAIYNPRSNTFHLLSEIQKPVNQMSIQERFSYRQKLIDELYNPFNEYDDLGYIEDKLLILDRYEMQLEGY